MTQDEHWQTMFDAYMKFMEDNKRCPSKYKAEERKLVNWLKYNRKMRNKGLLDEARLAKLSELFELSEKYRRVNQHAYLNGN